MSASWTTAGAWGSPSRRRRALRGGQGACTSEAAIDESAADDRDVRGRARPRGPRQEFGELAEEVNRLGIEIGDPALRIVAWSFRSTRGSLLGRLGEALALAEEGIALGAEDPSARQRDRVACPVRMVPDDQGRDPVLHWARSRSRHRRSSARCGSPGSRGTSRRRAGRTPSMSGWRATRARPRRLLAHATQSDEIAERIGSALSRVWSLSNLGYAHLMLGETDEAIAEIERSIDLARRGAHRTRTRGVAPGRIIRSPAQRGRSTRGPWRRPQESVALALERGNQALLPTCYRVLAEALLASEDQDRIAAVQQALENAIAAMTATGARSELPIIEGVHERLMLVS